VGKWDEERNKNTTEGFVLFLLMLSQLLVPLFLQLDE
jgi:hypothetical protein